MKSQRNVGTYLLQMVEVVHQTIVLTLQTSGLFGHGIAIAFDSFQA